MLDRIWDLLAPAVLEFAGAILAAVVAYWGYQRWKKDNKVYGLFNKVIDEDYPLDDRNQIKRE